MTIVRLPSPTSIRAMELLVEVGMLGMDAYRHGEPFADLVAAYLADRGETLETVEVVDAHDGIGSVLADPRAWRLYHAEHADLRMVSKSAHAARSRGQKAKR